MILYWGVFTLGFMGGVLLSLGIFHKNIFSPNEKNDDIEQQSI
jgi:hypothetical protein